MKSYNMNNMLNEELTYKSLNRNLTRSNLNDLKKNNGMHSRHLSYNKEKLLNNLSPLKHVIKNENNSVSPPKDDHIITKHKFKILSPDPKKISQLASNKINLRSLKNNYFLKSNLNSHNNNTNILPNLQVTNNNGNHMNMSMSMNVNNTTK
jgi:hypothetical protein